MDETQKAIYINKLAELGLEAHARKAARVTIGQLRKAMEADPDFAEQVEEAQLFAAEVLEQEARRRAVEGVDRDVYYKGEVVGVETQYSDTLLIALLKANNPTKFNQNNMNITGDKDKPMTVVVKDLTTDTEIRRTHDACNRVREALANGEVQDDPAEGNDTQDEKEISTPAVIDTTLAVVINEMDKEYENDQD